MKLCQWGHGAPHGCRRREPEHPRERFEVLEALGSGALRAPEVTASPLGHVDLPAVRGARERIASPDEAAALLAALPAGDRAVWATAL
jgi:hypothetical protein